MAKFMFNWLRKWFMINAVDSGLYCMHTCIHAQTHTHTHMHAHAHAHTSTNLLDGKSYWSTGSAITPTHTLQQ